MTKELMAKLVLIAARQPHPYDCYATLNHKTGTYSIRQYCDILPTETAVRLVANYDGNLLDSIRAAVLDIAVLNV